MVAAPIWMQVTNWRESGRQVRFGPLDGRLSIFLVLVLLFPGKTLLALCICAMVFFYYLEYKGYTLPNAYRKIKTELAGKREMVSIIGVKTSLDINYFDIFAF